MSRLEPIVAACGGQLMAGGREALIPGPGHSAADRSVSLRETEDGRLLIHCFSPKDDWRAVRAALVTEGLLSRSDFNATNNQVRGWAAPKPVARNEDGRARATTWWRQSRSLSATLAQRYLERRAIAVASAEEALRFHPRMTSFDDRLRRPAMMAALTDRDDALQGVHATLLAPSGAKASVATPRRVIGRLLGGAVRLSAPGATLVIAEGVESAMSAGAFFGEPSWAALSAYNLALFEPPQCVARLIIAADNDDAGFHAAQSLRDRLAPSLSVEIAPPKTAKDWNDWARAAR